MLREDPRFPPLNQLPLGFQDVGHEVRGKSAFCWAVVPAWSPTTMLPSSLYGAAGSGLNSFSDPSDGALE